MTQMPENRLCDKLIKAIRNEPMAWAHKIHGSNYGNAGEPDIDACVMGRAVKVEVKMPGKVPTPIQYAALRRWERAGALAGYVTSMEELLELLTHVDDWHWKNPQLKSDPPSS